MGVIPPPLTIRFARRSALVDARDPWLRGCLERHMRDCLGRGEGPVATFHLAREEGVFQYWRDDLLCLETGSAGKLLEPLMQDLLMRLIAPIDDQLILHAAAVALADQGILLCGGTGAGKSTLAAILVADGFDYLSDETVAIPPSLDEMEGFARSIVLKDDWPPRWIVAGTRLSSPLALSLPGGITWLPSRAIGKGGVQQHSAISRILFIRYQAGCALETVPLSGAECGFHLIRHLANAQNLPGYGLSWVSRLSQRVPAFQVTYGQATGLIRWLRDSLGYAG